MPRRISPMATSLTRSWRALADTAIAAKAGAEHGQRGQRVAEIARQTQATPVLIRRAVTARVAFMRLEERGIVVPDAVFLLPVGVAEAVARWARRDPEAAWRHADDYAQDRISFQSLIDAERRARGSEIAVRTPRLRPDDPAAAWRVGQLQRFATAGGRRVTLPAPDDLPVHGWSYGEASAPTGLLVVGPYDDPQFYMAQRGSHCVTAVGISRLVGCAIIIVPSDEVSVRYSAWLAERSVSSKEVGVATIVPKDRIPRRKRTPPDGDAQP